MCVEPVCVVECGGWYAGWSGVVWRVGELDGEGGGVLAKTCFSFQYFYYLPHKISELDFHSVGKMISASRRIFLVLFIYFLIFPSVFLLFIYLFFS